ncbi:MAG: conjugal transfer protein, partial [Solirubrobacterales bacterium]|nr:conjugal transfer protein [Solirubrobacterales bacterium]
LWIVLAIIFARGLSQIVNPTEPVTSGDGTAGATWPDAATAAFALDFARTYLSFSGDGDPDELSAAYNQTVEAFFTPDLQGDISEQAELPGNGVQQLYFGGQVVDAASLDADHAVLTVDALIQQEVPGDGDREPFSGQKRVFLTVPIGRDGNGDLALFANPGVVAEAPTGEPSTLDAIDVAEPGSADITDTTTRFLAEYLAGGGAGDLERFVAPGARVQPFEGGFKLNEPLISVEQVGGELDTPSTRSLLVSASVEDQTTGTTYVWQYFIDVNQQLDRWYVTQIKGGIGGPASVVPAPTADDSAAGAPESTSTTSTSEPTGSE